MTPRSSLAGLGLAIAGCIAPPSRYELASSAPSRPAEHACCLHGHARELAGGPESSRAELEVRGPALQRLPQARPELGPSQMARPQEAAEPAPGGAEAQASALAQELQHTRQALESARRALSEQSQASEDLLARMEELGAELERRTSATQALAARLVQAQIRRLEAEKLLLEHRIAAERARLAAGPAGDP